MPIPRRGKMPGLWREAATWLLDRPRQWPMLDEERRMLGLGEWGTRNSRRRTGT